MTPPAGFRCPRCLRLTFHPEDVRQEYCPCCGNGDLPKVCPHNLYGPYLHELIPADLAKFHEALETFAEGAVEATTAFARIVGDAVAATLRELRRWWQTLPREHMLKRLVQAHLQRARRRRLRAKLRWWVSRGLASWLSVRWPSWALPRVTP